MSKASNCMRCDANVACAANLKAHICMKRDPVMRERLTDRAAQLGANSGHKMLEIGTRLNHNG